jgi:hypothetical protein
MLLHDKPPKGTRQKAVRTIHTCGDLRVSRDMKRGKFDVTCGLSGMTFASFGTLRVATAFVDRLGKVWSELLTCERLHKKLKCVIALFAHDDMGEDDNGLPYRIVGIDYIRAQLPNAWLYPSVDEDDPRWIGKVECVEFGGPCAQLPDGSLIMRGRYTKTRPIIPAKLIFTTEITWLRFSTSTRGVLEVTRHKKLVCALAVKNS